MERRRLLDLPSGYTLLNYIQSTGKQVIDTGVVYDVDDLEVRGVINVPNVTQQVSYPFLSGISNRNGVNGRACAFVLSWDVSPVALVFSNKPNSDSGNSYSAFNMATDTSIRGTLKNNRTTLYINGSQVGSVITYTTNWSTCTHSLPLFGAWSNSLNAYNTNQAAKIIIKEWQFIKQGVLVRDFVPVMRISDSKVGMLDEVENVFYQDVIGEEEFLYG